MADNQEKKKVSFTIAGNQFTVLSAEEEAYTADIAGKIDQSIHEMCRNGRVSVTAAAILTAVNYCDEMQKSRRDLEEIRQKLEEYLNRMNVQQEKYRELSKECEKLKEDLKICRRRLSEESPGINEDDPISPAIRPVRRSIAVSDSEEAADEI